MTVILDRKANPSSLIIMRNELPLADPVNHNYRRVQRAYIQAGLLQEPRDAAMAGMSRSDSAYELSPVAKQAGAGAGALSTLPSKVQDAFAAQGRLAPKLRVANFVPFWSKVSRGFGVPMSAELQRQVLVLAIHQRLLPAPREFVVATAAPTPDEVRPAVAERARSLALELPRAASVPLPG